MHDAILQKLHDIEAQDSVKVLFACESGSRAWGFESPDSDFDVRFFYVRERDWYLSIEQGRDVLEYPINDVLDVNGWDLRKTFQLLRKCNPTLFEWLNSPIVYQERLDAGDALRSLLPQYFSAKPYLYHYLSMAKGNFRDFLQRDEVRLKKYFYVLRPILACMWVEQGKGIIPMAFMELYDAMVRDEPLRSAIDELLRKKRAAGEAEHGPRVDVIHDFIDTQLERLESVAQAADVVMRPDIDPLNDMFLSLLNRAWS